MAFPQYFISTCIVVIVQLTCPNTWINQYFHNCKICYRMQIYVYHYNELGWTWAWTSGTPRWVKWTCVVQNWVIFSMCTSVLCNTVGLMGDARDKMNIYSKQPCFYMIYFCYISQYADLYYMCVFHFFSTYCLSFQQLLTYTETDQIHKHQQLQFTAQESH